jgi:hypothetical protein
MHQEDLPTDEFYHPHYTAYAKDASLKGLSTPQKLYTRLFLLYPPELLLKIHQNQASLLSIISQYNDSYTSTQSSAQKIWITTQSLFLTNILSNLYPQKLSDPIITTQTLNCFTLLSDQSLNLQLLFPIINRMSQMDFSHQNLDD